MRFWGVWVRDLFLNHIVPREEPRRHPGLEFFKYHNALSNRNFENAEETKRNASEGFQGLSMWIEFSTVLPVEYGLFFKGCVFHTRICKTKCSLMLSWSIFHSTSQSCPAGYRLWINGLFMWHKSHPELSLHLLQMVTQCCSSKQIKLANAAYTLCVAVRERGIRDLTLPLANGLLRVLDADTRPQKCMCVMSLLKSCRAVYCHLDIKFVFELLDSMMSWTDRKVRREAICMAGAVLEAILMDDEAFARSCHKVISIVRADNSENMDEAAAEKQKLIDLLKDSKVRSGKNHHRLAQILS